MSYLMSATYIGVTLVTLVLMCVYINGILSENLYSDRTIRLYSKANIISQSVSEMWDTKDEDITGLRAEDITSRLLAGTSIRGIIVNGSYIVLYDNNREADMLKKVFMRDVLKRALDGEQVDSSFESDSGKTITVSVPIEANGEIVGGVYLAENVSSITETISTIRTSLIIFSILIAFVVGGMSIGTSHIITQPISEFIEVAQAISKGDFSRRAKVKGMREIAQMGEALNYMCDELNALDEKRKNFVSDVSHELKTPMAGIKLLCDSLIEAENPDMATVREFLGDMSNEIDRLTRLINKLLTLSRLDAKSGLSISKVDINALCAGVVRSLSKIAEEKHISFGFSSHIDEGVMIDADYDKLYESVYNITENAIKYTPEGGMVTARLRRADGSIIIEVEDTGPGIPDSEKTRVFERFYRLDDSRARDTGGTGLGLAITNEAIRLLGGSIEVVDGSAGGSRFTIRLPENTPMSSG
ncbi:MAG: HAMP domain-containing protein [Clostridia bacterium]|nr:HAMP domain-containing protein [Clostridia bacterium]